jgi:hypothetical protein
MLQLPNQPISIGRVFASGAQLWRATVSKTWFLALLLFAWGVLPYFLEPNLNTHNPFAWANNIVEQGLAAVIYFLAALILYAAVFAQLHRLLLEKPASVIGAIGTGIRKLSYLVVALIFAGVSLAAGFLALLIPGVIMMIVFMAYFPLIIMDDLNPIAAYKRCFELMLNYWFRAFFVLMIPTAILFIVGAIIDVFGTYVLVVAHPAGHGELWLFNHVVKIILGAIYLPFYAPLVVTLINDLKLRRAKAIANNTTTPSASLKPTHG